MARGDGLVDWSGSFGRVADRATDACDDLQCSVSRSAALSLEKRQRIWRERGASSEGAGIPPST